MMGIRRFPEKFPIQKEWGWSEVVFTEAVQFCCPKKTVSSWLPAPRAAQSGPQTTGSIDTRRGTFLDA